MGGSKAKIWARADGIEAAARTLIGIIMATERSERGRSKSAELDLEVELTAGGIETWRITIERTASSH